MPVLLSYKGMELECNYRCKSRKKKFGVISELLENINRREINRNYTFFPTYFTLFICS